MQSEELPSSGYEFTYIEEANFSYFFQTISGILYQAIFKPSGYIFSELPQELQQNVYEFSLLIVEQPEIKLLGSDKLISNTVATIFSHFFLNKQRVAVYIVENTDKRSDARLRKFNQWFTWFNAGQYFQLNLSMGADKNGEAYHTSIIFHVQNDNIGVMVQAFRNLIFTYKK